MSRKGTSMSASLVTGCSGLRALEHEQTDKHKLVTHNLGDIGKVRVRAALLTLLISPGL